MFFSWAVNWCFDVASLEILLPTSPGSDHTPSLYSGECQTVSVCVWLTGLDRKHSLYSGECQAVSMCVWLAGLDRTHSLYSGECRSIDNLIWMLLCLPVSLRLSECMCVCLRLSSSASVPFVRLCTNVVFQTNIRSKFMLRIQSQTFRGDQNSKDRAHGSIIQLPSH